MIKKFPFEDSILKDLGILQPDKTSSYSATTLLNLAKRFPQIGLSDPELLLTGILRQSNLSDMVAT